MGRVADYILPKLKFIAIVIACLSILFTQLLQHRVFAVGDYNLWLKGLELSLNLSITCIMAIETLKSVKSIKYGYWLLRYKNDRVSDLFVHQVYDDETTSKADQSNSKDNELNDNSPDITFDFDGSRNRIRVSRELSLHLDTIPNERLKFVNNNYSFVDTGHYTCRTEYLLFNNRKFGILSRKLRSPITIIVLNLFHVVSFLFQLAICLLAFNYAKLINQHEYFLTLVLCSAIPGVSAAITILSLNWYHSYLLHKLQRVNGSDSWSKGCPNVQTPNKALLTSYDCNSP